MADKPVARATRRFNTSFDHKLGPIPISRLGALLIAVTLSFIVLVALRTLLTVSTPSLYIVLREQHFHLSRFGFALALVMLGLAIYIGLIRRGDVTPYFRRGTYTVFGLMLVEALIGATLYFAIGMRPGQEVHLIYGMGSVLALPFFIFVEVTAQKRPAMGSYIWGFALLAGVLIRSMGTGPA